MMFLVQSLEKVASWAMKLVSIVSLCLQHCLDRILLDWKRRFLYEFSVVKLVLLSVRGYLGEIESEKMLVFFSFLVCFYCAVLCQDQRFQFACKS